MIALAVFIAVFLLVTVRPIGLALVLACNAGAAVAAVLFLRDGGWHMISAAWTSFYGQ